MARCVVDASVVVKWFLEEEFSDEARELRNDHLSDRVSAEAPAILPFEVLNAARFSGALDRMEVARIAGALDQAGIVLHGLSGPFAVRTTDLAFQSELTVYDASYAALALLLGQPLYTADQGLLHGGAALGDVRHIRTYNGPEGE